MTKHTKGPWDLSNLKTRIIEIKPAPEAPDERGNRLAHVIFSYTPDNRDYPACQVELEANARLIAAAPELLKALKAILVHFEGRGSMAAISGLDFNCYAPELELAKEAINKAKGVI